MSALISCFWIAIEIAAMLLLESAFLNRRRPLWRSYIAILAFYAACVLIDVPLQDYIPPLAQKTLNVAISAAAAALVFSGPWYACAAAGVSSYFFLAAMDMVFVYFAAMISGQSLEELINRQGTWFFIVTADKLFCLLLFYAVYRLMRDRGNRERGLRRGLRRTLLAALLPFVSFAVLFELFLGAQEQGDLSGSIVAVSLIVMAANAAFLFLIDSLDKANAAERELALQNQSMALQTENYEALEKSYRAQRSASHEFRHRLQVISELLEAGRADEARAYVSELQHSHTVRLFAANSGHPIVDAILNEKYQRARGQDIDISYTLSDLSGLKISSDALVVLLSNLLENAIEACVKLPEGRVIECSLLLGEDLLLSVRNSSPPVSIRGDSVETTKSPAYEHGYGLSGVKRIIAELGGEYAVDYTEPWFQFTADIPNEERKS